MRLPDLEIDHLRAFAAVAATQGFTAAGETLGLTQSAVSQQVKRLEDAVGRKLLDRTSRSIGLTVHGERFLEYARRMLELNDEAVRKLAGGQSEMEVLRLGVTEDFVPGQLAAILGSVAKSLPGMRPQLSTGLSTRLLESLERGDIDLVLAKREERRSRGGRVIWRERLAWIAAEGFAPDQDGPLPLVMLPAPCSYRAVMLAALAAAAWPWREACTAGSILAVRAAVEAGIGVSILGASFLGPGVRELAHPRLPRLPQTEIALFGAQAAFGEAAEAIRKALPAVIGGQGLEEQ
jgi:DNA-binding transcriptional LysR family regulator